MYKLILAVLVFVGFTARAQEPGDLAVVGISTTEMMYISLAYIPEGTVLHITERIWNGSSWDPGADGGSGNTTITIGAGGMPANSYILIENLATTPSIATGGNYFSNAVASNGTSFSFDFQGNNTGTCTILTVHSASTFNSDPTGTYIWVIALGNFNVLGSTYGIPENCAVNRSNNANITTTSLSPSGTSASKDEALNYIDSGSNWTNGTTASSLSVPIIASIDLVNTTWNGSSWDNGTPNTSTDAFIAGAYNTATDGALTVGDSLTIQDGVTLTVDDATNSSLLAYGAIHTNTSGTIVLEGSNSGYATIPSSASFSGSGTIQYQIQVNEAGWHHFSAPGTVTLSNISFNNGMSLSYSGATANIYAWDATTSGWVLTSSGANFGSVGYAIYFPSAQLMTIPITATNMNNAQETDALSYHDPAGNPPGNSATGWTTGVEDGWNLVRNPFPEYLDWDLLDNDGANLSNMDAAVYIWDPTAGSGTGAYVSYSSAVGGAFGISPIQAFFVRSSNSSGSLIKPIDSRATSGNEYLGKTETSDIPRFRLTATVDGFTKTHSFAFLKDASTNKDRFDTYAFQGGGNIPFFYSTTADSIRVDNQAWPINFSTIETYLSCFSTKEGANATITLDDDQLTYFPLNIYLLDLHTMNVVDLTAQRSYAFVIDSTAPVQRFRLMTFSTGIEIPEFQVSELAAHNAQDQLVLRLSESSETFTCQLLNWNGQLIHETDVTFSQGEARLPTSKRFEGIVILKNAKEYYVVKVL
ncbi:autotransporter outer membrane beta-barrel domain-containing protein [Phaeocystidibacter luteus]|uniref:G8 domain-containing protein n=1 Tax=Phaeocystidibacter luteus TaxID=911197 RepID=A0A6N6RE40_9FLAO|nr:hypothetical protein [Phaeocystidibacter luteus]KAB2805438.1 hypothetical protein F8C67_13370 [Phaeocystidibacter luteus]